MKLLSSILVGVLSLGAAQSFGQNIKASELKGIRVLGFKGRLNIIADAKLQTVQHRVLTKTDLPSHWSPQVELENGWLNIRVSGPVSKEEWRTQTPPRVDIEIRAPPMPLQVVWSQGDIYLKGWDKSAEITHQVGTVKVEDTKGEMKLSVHEGELSVKDHSGRLEVDNFGSKIRLEHVSGTVKIDNFQGRLSVSDGGGNYHLSTVRGKNFIDDFNGDFDFNNKQGEIVITQSGGQLQGKSDSGTVEARLIGSTEVRLRSQEARITVALKRGLGAKVNLGSADGQVASSLGLKVDKIDGWKVIKGEVSGKSVSQISVQSRSGDIRLRSL